MKSVGGEAINDRLYLLDLIPFISYTGPILQYEISGGQPTLVRKVGGRQEDDDNYIVFVKPPQTTGSFPSHLSQVDTR